jgi:hypothetical protein
VLVRGVVPREMEDHWFIFEEDDVVHLYRSWTLWEAFAIRLHRLADGGAEIAEVAANDEHARAPIEEFDSGASDVLDVFFDSFSETPTGATVVGADGKPVPLGLARHVYGLHG